MIKNLSPTELDQLLNALQTRFDRHSARHSSIIWSDVLQRLHENPQKCSSLNEMERTGGEPDVIGKDEQTGEYIFCDCSAESPAGRRSLCFDQQALDERKEHKPVNSAIGLCAEMGVQMLDETQYRDLQKLGTFDARTSSWIQTPQEIRKLGGALFADYRYDTVFVYHNGAQSYYAARGFRAMLRL